MNISWLHLILMGLLFVGFVGFVEFVGLDLSWGWLEYWGLCRCWYRYMRHYWLSAVVVITVIIVMAVVAVVVVVVGS